MPNKIDPISLSDGTTITVRIERGPGGTVYHEVPSRRRPGSRLMRIGTGMFLVMRESIGPIEDPRFAHAGDDAEGAEVALAFFAESAEACIQHAREFNIPVERCYA
jgi:hypothetical protein